MTYDVDDVAGARGFLFASRTLDLLVRDFERERLFGIIRRNVANEAAVHLLRVARVVVVFAPFLMRGKELAKSLDMSEPDGLKRLSRKQRHLASCPPVVQCQFGRMHG